jgi:hypothetical protein
MPLKKIAIGAGLIVGAVILVPVVLASITFDTMFPPNGELAQKTEWSVLQGVEAQHRDTAQSTPALVVRHALNSEFTAIGFPARGRDKGYVWLLANPTTKPCIKQMPHDLDFNVTADVVGWLKGQTSIDPRVTAYLESSQVHVTGLTNTPIHDREGCRG